MLLPHFNLYARPGATNERCERTRKGFIRIRLQFSWHVFRCVTAKEHAFSLTSDSRSLPKFQETAMQRGHHTPDAELRRFPSCLWRDSDPDYSESDEV